MTVENLIIHGYSYFVHDWAARAGPFEVNSQHGRGALFLPFPFDFMLRRNTAPFGVPTTLVKGFSCR
jgi:hypothetical protein